MAPVSVKAPHIIFPTQAPWHVLLYWRGHGYSI